MTNTIRLYKMIVLKEAQRFFTYRGNIFAGCLAGILMLAGRYALWSALFATGNAGGATLTETMTFFVINDILMLWLAASYSNNIGADVQSGDIALGLIRPFPYHFRLIANFHSRALTRTISSSLPMLVVAIVFIGLSRPASLMSLGFFIISLILGGVIYALIDFIISYTTFWLVEFWYLSWFKNALFILFGGVMLPLWFYPDWLLAICRILPFQLAIFMPIEIYLGRVPVSDAGYVLAMQVFWVIILFAIERAFWKLAQHKLMVQGG